MPVFNRQFENLGGLIYNIKLSKIIYYVEDDTLFIADVWATRQDPDYLKNRFEK